VTPREGHIYPEDIAKQITDHTRLLAISFVEFFTGFLNDLERIGEICQQHEILFSVDGIQGVGAIPIDVQKAQIDFLANGGHKWLMSPMGCGFLYIKPKVLSQMRPVFAGWLSVKDSWNFSEYNLDFLDNAERFEIGTPNFLGMIGARAATDILVEIGPENTYTHLLCLGDVLIEGLEAMGLQYIGSRIETHRSGIYTFKAQREEALFKYLQAHHVHVALRQGAVRISPHYYNTEDEIRQLINLCRKFYKR
jgi:selenocysteine lyase/cysteine desulfurase